MKGISAAFWVVVAAIGMTFAANVYTAIRHKKETVVEDTNVIAVPALPATPANP